MKGQAQGQQKGPTALMETEFLWLQGWVWFSLVTKSLSALV